MSEQCCNDINENNMKNRSILEGAKFSVGINNAKTLSLFYRNWNDFGYYTLFSLSLDAPASYSSYTLALIRVMYFGQESRENPQYGDLQRMRVFICDVEGAERIFLMLSPSERLELEKVLGIGYDVSLVMGEPAFQKSVLRCTTLDEFQKTQLRIKELMHSNIDASAMLSKNKQQLQLYMNDLCNVDAI